MAELTDRLQAALGPGYRVERELGGGGMSRVFVAEELELGRKVVVKVLPPEMALGVNADRFRREIQLAASLQHPHIVPLLAAGHSDDLVWYTMPLIEGESLRAKLAREGELPVSEAVRLLRDVADALAHAHQHGVVHRDIKPDNVLLTGQHAVVTDFGVAKAITTATGATSLTSVGLALGTPAYMAPEQATGSSQVDHRADVYALGAVGYELLTGRPPFVGLSPEATLAAHVTQAPEPVTQHRAAVPGAVAAVVMRCLEKKPADRWQTAAELHAQLESLATPSGGMAPTGAALAFAHRLAGRPTRSAIVAATVLAAVAILAYGASRVIRGRGAGGGRGVAVLTFERLLADTGDEYVAEGLADGISTALGQVPRLTVVSRTAVRRIPDVSRLSPGQLGERLRAAYLVSGTIQPAAGRVQVTVELLNARSAEAVWTAHFDTAAADLLGVQTAIAEAVAARVAGRLLPQERAGLTRRPTSSPEAYDHFLRGNRLLPTPTEPSILAAIAQYQAAVALDSSFWVAWGRLAQAYAIALNYAYWPGGSTLDSLMARGMDAADRALTADSSLADAWLGRGALLAIRGRMADFGPARDAMRRAVGLDPSWSPAHLWYASVLRRLGEFDESEQEYYRALAIGSVSLSAITDLGFLSFTLRRYAAAARWFDRSISLDSSVVTTRMLRARTENALGERRAALADSRAALELASEGERGRALALLAEIENAEGQAAEARARFREALRLLGFSGGVLPASINVRVGYEYALVAVALGDRDLAIRILERTQPRGPWLWSYLIWEGFDPIRNDPRFRRIIDEARPPGAQDPV